MVDTKKSAIIFHDKEKWTKKTRMHKGGICKEEKLALVLRNLRGEKGESLE